MDHQVPRGMDNGSGFVAPGAHVNGMARPVVRTNPAIHSPRKMRVVVAKGAPDAGVAKRGSGLTKGPKEQEKRSMVTGKAIRNGRGLTSGWGMINGTGMVREAEFHRSVGRFNGSEMTRSEALGSREGMTNGSGLTEAGGLAEDAGLTNGCGLTHGEGMTNGCGLVQSMDPLATAPVTRPSPRRRGLRAILGV